MSNYLVKAILSLRPNAEFSMVDDDYSTIKWDVLNGEAPTQVEIDDEITRLQAAEATENAARLAAKAALLNRLGITSEEASVLLS